MKNCLLVWEFRNTRRLADVIVEGFHQVIASDPIFSRNCPVVMAFFLYFHVIVPSRTEFYSSVSHAIGGRATSPRSPTPLFHAMGGGEGAPDDSRHLISPDESRNQASQQQKQEPSAGSESTSGGVVCNNCDRLIV